MSVTIRGKNGHVTGIPCDGNPIEAFARNPQVAASVLLGTAEDFRCRKLFAGCGKWIGALMRKPGVERERKDFADFYLRCRDNCLRAVLAGTGDRELAEDLVAEAFARAWASWQRVSRHPAPAAWVVRTALNVRVFWWRRRRREVALNGHDQVQLAEEGLSVDQAVLTAVRGLPRRQREVVLLRIWLDLDTNAVAEELGISPSTVAVHLSRATATLREQFAPVAQVGNRHE